MAPRQESKYRAIMRTIEERIAEGLYPPDSAIPAERTLARELGTNHETVNKAISNLVAGGTLYRRRGIGTFVAPASAGEEPAATRKRIDILAYKRVDELFQSSSFHEEIMFVLQNELIGLGIGSEIIPVRDLRSFEEYLEGVDAVIVSRFLPRRLMNLVIAAGRPAVCLNFEYEAPGVSSLIIDHAAVDDLASHLAGLGHRNMAFALGTGFNLFHEARRLRFLRSMELLELEDNLSRVFQVDPSDESAGAAFMRKIEGCTAVMAADDLLAVQLRSLFLRFGRRVPQDISLCGYGNLSLTGKIYPELTTADTDRDAFCAAAVREITSLLQGEHSGRTLTFAGKPIFRSSTSPVKLS